MLELKNIQVRFGNNHVLKNMSCRVERGDFIVIIGANGAGKSTFFDLIAGKITPSCGTISLDGADVTQSSELVRSSMITRIFQNTRLNSVGTMTVAQNLALARYSRRTACLVDGMQILPEQDAVDLIRNIGMDPAILNRKMADLSGGQRQLIAFAMATQLIPKVLLLDEPTAALDPQAATKLLKHATQFINTHNITTLLITHDPHIALSIGNKIWILEHGTISKQFTSTEKTGLNPDKLIGQIDYASLTAMAK